MPNISSPLSYKTNVRKSDNLLTLICKHGRAGIVHKKPWREQLKKEISMS